MNEPIIYPNRAVQAVSSVDTSPLFCTTEEIIYCLSLTHNRIESISCVFRNDNELDYYNSNMTTDINRSAEIAVSTREQNSNEWMFQRSTRITASSCYKLYTYLRNKTPNWTKKIDNYWNTKPLGVKAVIYGRNVEVKAFECYRRMRNPLIKKCGLVIHPAEPWIAGSPDGVDPLTTTLLEIKCPVGSEASLEDILQSRNVKRYLKRSENAQIYELNQNHEYYCQVQVNLWILNCSICDFIVYSEKDNDFIVVEIPYNLEYTSKIVNSLKQLYFDKMFPTLIK